jgi:serine/threonine protein kinase
MGKPAKPAAPPSRHSSLIVSLVAALLAVAALPFALAAYQIRLARDSLVDQTQLTHLVAARASADRVQTLRATVSGTLRDAAGNPALFSEPGSEAAGEVLRSALVAETQIMAAATFFRDEQGEDHLVHLARRPEAAAIEAPHLQALSGEMLFVEVAGLRLLGQAAATGREGLRIAVFASANRLQDIFLAEGLGSTARVQLVDGDRPHPLFGAAALPSALREALARPAIPDGAFPVDGERGREVVAFARIPGSRWAIVSRQPAEDAEQAATAMRNGALAAAAMVLAVVALLAVFAWKRVVQPVRALLAWQRRELPASGGGGDLAELQTAFRQIQQLQRNREALNEVFLGRYKLLSTLGQGAMGSVFLAWDPRLKRHVAIKTIHLDALDPGMQAALAKTLENEAVAVAHLQHPNIVAVHDLVAAGEFAFVVMEYVEGGNLRAVVGRNGALSPAEVVQIARAMLGALQAAHGAGLLHLDIKPGNVLVPPRGELKLTDFGVAAWRFEVPDLVRRGGLAGTPGFIAPEYIAGQPPNERADLYSLGRLLYECLTGAAQHLPGAHTGDLRRVAERPLDFPEHLRRQYPALCAAVEALCASDPARRPADAGAALALFADLDAQGGAAQLAQRARELSRDTLLDEPGDGGDATSAAPGDTTAPARRSDDTTRPPPGADITRPATRNDDTTHPPPSSAARGAALDATRPPPRSDATQRLPDPDPDRTRPPPRRP